MLERCLTEARTAARVVDIMAGAGIGKSRLLHEFRCRIADERAFILSCGCSSDGQRTPFLNFIGLLRGWFHLSPGEAEPQVAHKLETGLTALGARSDQNLGLLLNLLGLKPPESALAGLDGMLIRSRTRDLLLQLLEAQSQASYVVLFFEDLHWIDAASEELLARIVGTQLSLPLLIICTRRPDYCPPWIDQNKVTAMALAPLSPAETSWIVQRRLGVDPLPEALGRLLSERAEGNPLFAEELATHLLERGIIRKTGSGVEFDPKAVTAALPLSLQAVLTARIDRLPQLDRTLLQTAAVIGRRFDPDLLAVVTSVEIEDLAARMDYLHQLDLVYRDSRTREYFFKHVLVRDALYERLLSTQRAELHLKVAEGIERRGGNRLHELTELLAYHYERSGEREKTIQYKLLAGRKSLDIYSLDEAERYFREALSALESGAVTIGSTLADIIVPLLEVILLKGNYVEVKRVAELYLPRLQGKADSPELAISLGSYSVALGSMDQIRDAVAAARRAVEIAERTGDPKARAHAYYPLFCWSAFSAPQPLDEAKWRGAQLLADSRATSDNYLLNLSHFCIALDYAYRGLANEARDWARTLMEAGRKRGDRRALSLASWVLSWIELYAANYEEGIRYAEQSMQAAVIPTDRVLAAVLKAIGKILSGHCEEGLSEIEGLRLWARANGFLYLEGGMNGGLAIGLISTGRIGDGIRLLAKAIVAREAVGDRAGATLARGALAEIYVEMLTSRQVPSVRVIVRNIGIILQVRLFGAQRARKLLEQAVCYEQLHEDGIFRARYDMNLGLLCQIKRQHDKAKELMQEARRIAAYQNCGGLVRKIDAALSSIRA